MPAKLLIADDSTTIQKVFERTFPPEEFTLCFANNGEEALTKARTESPNLIIADISMPVKSGFELCAALKQDSALKGIPVLLLIGILDDFDEDESRRVGADGFLIKPFEATAAISKVRAALAKGGSVLPAVGPAGAQTDEILELADFVEGPPRTSPPLQRQAAEEILELADIVEKPHVRPTPPPQEQAEEFMELADIVAEPAAMPSSPPPREKKEEEFVLQSSLRELEEELKAEFPEEKGEDKVAPSFLEEEKKESWSLELDLPFDELELEPKPKDADWTGLFGDLSSERPGQEIKDERLETILGESATELEKIEGLPQGKDDVATKREEEFAEKFMEDFEPVFAPGEELQHIDVLEKDLKGISSDDAEDLAERVVAAVGRELKGAVEEMIKDKVPKLVRQMMEQSKKG
ncbi:MAG: response regulator [Desulfobacterales bacterium]|nr:response regulator [Desulfobacterales bacterium]